MNHDQHERPIQGSSATQRRRNVLAAGFGRTVSSVALNAGVAAQALGSNLAAKVRCAWMLALGLVAGLMSPMQSAAQPTLPGELPARRTRR